MVSAAEDGSLKIEASRAMIPEMAATSGDEDSPLAVEVRRPFHRPHPIDRLRGRWRRRRERAGRDGEDDDRSNWWDGLDFPIPDVDSVAALLIAVVVIVVAIVALVFVGPYVWILVLFVVDIVVWLGLLAIGGLAWLVFRRPWEVAVVDGDGTTLATTAVDGRRRAHDHATVVQRRLDAGSSPVDSVRPTF